MAIEILSPANAQRADAALARLGREAADAKRAADDAGGWFSSLIGTESAANAIVAQAHALDALYSAMKAKRPKLTDSTVVAFLRDAGEAVTDGAGSWRAVDKLITPGGAAAEVGVAVARDVGSAAVAVGNSSLAVLKVLPWLALVAGAFLVYSYARK